MSSLMSTSIGFAKTILGSESIQEMFTGFSLQLSWWLLSMSKTWSKQLENAYGMDVNLEKGLALVANNFGFLHLVDARTNHKTSDAILIHKKGTRFFGLHCNAVHPDLLLSCGNDHFVSSLPFSFSYYH
ncbi:hypothetical protein K1719_035015 [Acacia pycnantha]|nr:hypothetical protein K1719_035015 [Acacia pycnantha]